MAAAGGDDEESSSGGSAALGFLMGLSLAGQLGQSTGNMSLSVGTPPADGLSIQASFGGMQLNVQA